MRTLAGTPPAGASDVSVTVTARDPQGNAASEEFWINTPTSGSNGPVAYAFGTTLSGSRGEDYLRPKDAYLPGRDVRRELLVGGSEADDIYPGDGGDVAYGGEGDDFIYFSSDNTVVDGGGGDDWFNISPVDVSVIGGSGRDVLNLVFRREQVQFARDGDWTVVTSADNQFTYTMRLREVEEIKLREGQFALADLLPPASARRDALARVPLSGGLMSRLGDPAPASTGGLLAAIHQSWS